MPPERTSAGSVPVARSSARRAAASAGARGVEARRLGAVGAEARARRRRAARRAAAARAPARSPRCAGRRRAARTGSPRRARARSCAPRPPATRWTSSDGSAIVRRWNSSPARRVGRARAGVGEQPRRRRAASPTTSISACDGGSTPARSGSGGRPSRAGQDRGEQPVQRVERVQRGAAVHRPSARAASPVRTSRWANTMPRVPTRQRGRVGVDHAGVEDDRRVGAALVGGAPSRRRRRGRSPRRPRSARARGRAARRRRPARRRRAAAGGSCPCRRWRRGRRGARRGSSGSNGGEVQRSSVARVLDVVVAVDHHRRRVRRGRRAARRRPAARRPACRPARRAAGGDGRAAAPTRRPRAAPPRCARRPRSTGSAASRRARGSRRRGRSLADLITASVSPAVTEPPSVIGSSAILPALCAVISFSIFIASMMHTSAPSSTSAPCSTSTLKTLPCSGEASVSPPPPPPPALRSRSRRGLRPRRRWRGAAAAIASPCTTTSKRLPRDLDDVGRAPRSPAPSSSALLGLRERELLEPLAVLDQVAAGLALGPLLGGHDRLVERDQGLDALDLELLQRPRHPPRGASRGRRPRRSAWRPSGHTAA